MTQTPSRQSLRVPPGALLCHPKWRKSFLASKLDCRCVYEEELRVVDFMPANDTGVTLLTEDDIEAGPTVYRRRLAKLKNGGFRRALVIVMRPLLCDEDWDSLQSFALFSLSLTLLPVTSYPDAALLLSNMVGAENRSPGSNVFRGERRVPVVDQGILDTVCGLPGVGGNKAKLLLKRFKSIQGICNASQEELSGVVGSKVARDVWAFFNHR